MDWFTVDKAGLAKLLHRRGKQFVLYELVANGWDQTVTTVQVSLTKKAGERFVTLIVQDDDPEGFADLTHAFTLFAESTKKDDPAKRGRFNLGEKLVLALCDQAEIVTTTGGVRFDSKGRHLLRSKRPVGSCFTGRIKMTNVEFDACVTGMQRLIPPAGITTHFEHSGGDMIVLPMREPIARFDASLPTEIADDEGNLRRTTRKTSIEVHEPLDGEIGSLYEMGIPVVETGDRYHVNIAQKVPLNLDRDNVPPGYLRDVRTLVLNAVHERITDDETANAGWVRDALADENVAPEAVETVVQLRFGKKAVAFDPNDREANNNAVAHGYTVVHGRQMSKNEWNNVRRTTLLAPAGRLFPTPTPYSDNPNAPPVKIIDEADMTEAERHVIETMRRLATILLGFTPHVRLVATKNDFDAAYGSRCLDLNRSRLGRQWFLDCYITKMMTKNALSLLIHELGHEYCGNHLDADYYRALTDLGAKLSLAVADRPAILRVS